MSNISLRKAEKKREKGKREGRGIGSAVLHFS